MNYELEYTKSFFKKLKKLDKTVLNNVLKALENILDNPYQGSLLIHPKERLWKWRVGDYRVIYKIVEKEKKVVLILVAHRKKVYKRF